MNIDKIDGKTVCIPGYNNYIGGGCVGVCHALRNHLGQGYWGYTLFSCCNLVWKRSVSFLVGILTSEHLLFSSCQQQLPATGVPITRQRFDHMRRMFHEYVRSRTLQNWKFWIVSFYINLLNLRFGTNIFRGKNSRFWCCDFKPSYLNNVNFHSHLYVGMNPCLTSCREAELVYLKVWEVTWK